MSAEASYLEEMGVEGVDKENPCLFFFMKPPRTAAHRYRW